MSRNLLPCQTQHTMSFPRWVAVPLGHVHPDWPSSCQQHISSAIWQLPCVLLHSTSSNSSSTVAASSLPQLPSLLHTLTSSRPLAGDSRCGSQARKAEPDSQPSRDSTVNQVLQLLGSSRASSNTCRDHSSTGDYNFPEPATPAPLQRQQAAPLCCPPAPVRPRPALMLVPVAELPSPCAPSLAAT